MPILDKAKTNKLKTQKLYKILNKKENHNGFQYKTGLNTDTIEFYPKGSCKAGGLYFSEVKDIFNFIDYGVWIREVTIPENEPVYKDPEGNKYKCHSLILGERKKLFTKTMFKRLIREGADIHAYNGYALWWMAQYGSVELVKLLIEAGADIHVNDDLALREAAENGRVETVKMLLELGADIHAENDYALQLAAASDHTEVVKALLEAGADIHADDDLALQFAADKGHTETVELLNNWIKEHG